MCFPYLMAARIPEKPAPMTLTFNGLRFSIGSSFNWKGGASWATPFPFVYPFV